MPLASSDGVDIHFETAGDPVHPAMVLLSGHGAQLISWHDDLVALLVGEGFFVVRMDNRDTGLSARFGGPEDVDGGYTTADMAGDVLRVLDHLGVERAFLVGHSMGGIIAQRAAIARPERVRGLGLLSTIPGVDRAHVLHDDPEPAVPPRFELPQLVAFAEEYARFDAASGPFDPQLEWHREKAVQAFERGYAPEGAVRQWAALRRESDRLPLLRELPHPALVFHGRHDGAIHWSAALATAEALAGAELQVHAGMGHLIPRELWPDLVAGLVRMTRRAA